MKCECGPMKMEIGLPDLIVAGIVVCSVAWAAVFLVGALRGYPPPWAVVGRAGPS